MSKLVCPLCGVYTSFSPLLLKGRGILLESSDSSDVHYTNVALEAVTREQYINMSTEDTCYAILVCNACDSFFVAKKEAYGEEWSAVYPIPHKPVAKEIPEPINGEFEEAHLCFALGAYRGCLLVCRTALIAMQREQRVSNLKELKDKGAISEGLYKQADEVRLWANMIGHEDVPEAVTKEDSEQLLTYLEALLNAVYVEPKRLAKLAQKREQSKKKQ